MNDTAQTTASSSPVMGFGSANYRAYALGALLLVYVFNFIDRTIINILTEPIKESFQLEDWQLGMLGGPAFAVLYTFLGIPIARFAERYNRVMIIAASVALWSLMTALCGFAVSFVALFLFRVGVSIGEAGCTPPAQSLIADYFRPSSRATAVSIYALGVPLGGMFAAVFGGFIAGNLSGDNIAAMFQSWNWQWAVNALDWSEVEGWRIAFVVVGLPGLLVAILVKMTLAEPPRGHTDPARLQNQEKASFTDALKILIKKPAYVHMVIGATVASFVGYGVGQFTTSFLVRTHGLTLQEAALLFGIILGVMAAIGVFSSGYLADRLAAKHPSALSWVPAIGLGVSVPLYVFGYLSSNLWIAMVPLMLAAMLHYYYLGPMYAIAGGVADSRMRATSVALTLFAVNLLGYGLGPPVIGFLSTFLKSLFLSADTLPLTLELCKAALDLSPDQIAACSSANAKGLQWSIIAFVCLYGWAAIHYLLAGRTLQSDMVTSAS